MDFRLLVKKLDVPGDFAPPTQLIHEDLVATAITRADLEEDVQGINASIDLIRRTRGGRWPPEPVTEEFNFVDLVWHELEFREGDSLTYVLRDTTGTYLGCCYLYPMGRRTELTEDLLRYEVDGTAVYRGQVAGAIPAGVPPEAAGPQPQPRRSPISSASRCSTRHAWRSHRGFRWSP